MDTLDIYESYLELESSHAVFDYIEFEGEQYVMSCAKSHGYREYKTEDNYSNDVYAFTFIAI